MTGKRGFVSQPREIAVKKGTYRKDLHGEIVKPDLEFIRTVPEPPSCLNEVGKICWNGLLSELVKIDGLITPVYLVTFEMLCVSYQTYRQALPETKDLFDYDERTGRRTANPAIKIMNDSIKNFITIGREFGLTPSAMDRINLKVDSENKEEEILNKY